LRAVADLAVHSFGGRHELYERFYAGDPIRLRAAQQYLGYDWSEANEILRRLLEELELPAREEFGLKPAEGDVLTHVTPS
jgi:4-hydroxyphenylacetate 3-monooxygenase